MWKYTFEDADPYALYHWGIQGQKWGIRRYQNPDGTLTEAGKKRYWGNGGDYTPVGRKRYIKDLVSDYNTINNTKVNLKKAVVRVDGKYYTGKGKELDPKDLNVIKGEQKRSEENAKILGADSKRKDFDSKAASKMTSEELRLANEYYERLNGYEKAGAEYAERHISSAEKVRRSRKKFFADQGEKFAVAVIGAVGAGVGAWIKAKMKADGGKAIDISGYSKG